uniref:Ancestral coatomer element 1 Sec16/Sec31 domain-containing protein n=1 Tax=Anopheles maculatus TaxID=74869 RepID=A0A182T7L0_9DIPT
AASNTDLARNAILCYICAGSTERLVEAWQLSKGSQPAGGDLGGDDELDKNNNSNRDLQELVEVSMLLQKALEKQGRPSQAVGKLADLLSQYAGLLAAQGSLPSALTYLGNSTDPEMEELRERLYYALGHKTYTPMGTGRPQYASQQQPPFNPMFPTIGQAAKLKAYGQTMPAAPVPTLNTAPSMPQQTSWSTTPFQQPPMGVVPPNPVANPVAPPPLATKPPVGPPPSGTGINNDLSQPPRPSSVSSQSGGSTLGRAKYVLDPSVQSGSNYGQQSSNFYNPMAYQQQPQQPNAPIVNQPPQQPMSNFYNPASAPGQPNNFKPFTPAPLVQASPYMPGISPLDVTQQQQQQQPGMGYPPPPPQATAAPPMANMQRNPTPPPGWNDPPALKSSSRPQVSVCV